MFKNIGKKIMVLAKVLCWIGIVVSVIAAICMFYEASQAYYGSKPGLITGGVVSLIFGPLFSWICAFTLYGFGKLVDNSDILVKEKEYYRFSDQQY